ncbi:hypothetical protein CRM22_004086 [Opisthorchis felineus]|nr:hypothetical protein CRM22_004086 [Opisthorchis felineus]
MGTEGPLNAKETKAKLDYLKELLTDRTILASDPHVYIHLGKILEQEILRIRSSLFSAYGIYTITDSELPEPEGPKVNLQTKVYMPTDPTNSFNFVGRILGPDGSTAKCLQQCLGVKIMVRGRGSMRDRKKEEANTGKPNWEHLNENLHVVLTVEDFENRAKARLAKASEYINLFLKESMKGSDKDDKVKQMQLMELSFRREPRPSWHFNCNSLLDVTLPPKPGALFPNAAAAANMLSFGYSYPPAQLFSPLHHNSHHHHHHFGPLTQPPPPPPQQQQQGSPLAVPGTNQHNHLAGLSHPIHANLSAAAMLMGHSLGSGGYTGPFSPTGHSHASVSTTSSMPGGALAMTPMNYWSGQSLSHLPPEYGVGHPHMTGQQTTANGYGIPENGTSLTSGTHPSQPASANGHTVFLSQHLPRLGHEDTISQCLLPEFNACSLNGNKELEPLAASSNGLHPMLHGSIPNHSQQTKHGGVGSSGSTVNTNGALSGTTKHGLKPRYSQKHASQIAVPPGHAADSDATVGRSQSRSTMVTVKVGTNERNPQKTGGPPTTIQESNGSMKELSKSDTKPEGKSVSRELNGTQNPIVGSPALSTSVKPLSLRSTNSEVEWPKLSTNVRDKSTIDVTSA